jgi:hypothetical protein
VRAGFALWLAIAVVGSLAWSALSWNMLQRRIRRNRAGNCANCGKPLNGEGARIGGLMLCPDCARRSRRVVTVAVRAIAVIVLLGTAGVFWVVHEIWSMNRKGAWLLLGLWGLYSGVLVFIAALSARDAREASRRVDRMERRLTPVTRGGRMEEEKASPPSPGI